MGKVSILVNFEVENGRRLIWVAVDRCNMYHCT